MITYTEAGITEEQYNAIKDGALPSNHKVIAHRLTPQFALLQALTGTAPFYATVTDMYLIVSDSAGTLHRYNLITEVWDTSASPFTGEVHLFADNMGLDLWAFYLESGVIKRKLSIDNGATWSAAETMQSTITSYTITKFAPVAADRVHFVAEHTMKKVQHLNMVSWSGSAWTRTQSDVYYPYPVHNMDAVVFDGNDVLFLDTEVPGEWSAENADLDETAEKYWEQTVALISFTVSNSSEWGYHTEIDRAVKVNNPDDFEGVQASVIGGKVNVTTYATVGTSGAPSQHVKAYHSDDGYDYSLPDILNLPGATASGNVFLQGDKMLYVTTNGEVYLGDATFAFGYDNPALREDISAHIADAGLSITRSTMQSVTITLNNFGGYFDNHAIISRNGIFALEIYATYFVDGTPVDVFLAKTYFDAISETQDGSSRYLTLESRDVMRFATDWVKAEDFHVQFAPISKTYHKNQTDLAEHFAVMEGTPDWTGIKPSAETASDEYVLLFATASSRLMNYGVNVQIPNTTNPGGVVVHGVDKDNCFLVTRRGRVIQRLNGVETVVNSGGSSDYGAIRVKYASIESTGDIETPNASASYRYLIDVSGLTATNGKYMVATNPPLIGSTGMWFQGVSAWHIAAFVISEMGNQLNLQSALDWYFRKAGIATTHQAHGESFPPQYWSVEDIQPITSPAVGYENALYDNDATYHETTFLYNTYGIIYENADSGTPATAFDVSMRLAAKNSNSVNYYLINFYLDYWDGTAWINAASPFFWFTYNGTMSSVASRINYHATTPVPASRVRIRATTAATDNFATIRIYAVAISTKIPTYTPHYPVIADEIEAHLAPSSGTHPVVARIAYSENDYWWVRFAKNAGKDAIELIRTVNGVNTTTTTLQSLSGNYTTTWEDAARELRVKISKDREANEHTYAVFYFVRYDAGGVGATPMILLENLPGSEPLYLAGFTSYTTKGNTEVFDAATLDPGESPMGGISRAVDGRYVKMFTRFDSTVKVVEPAPSSPVYTFSTEIREVERTYDTRELYSHVRLLGAYVEGEYVDEALTEIVGHRFIEHNNPYIMTETECVIEAKRLIRRMKEAADQLGFAAPFNPFLEPEDTITVGNYGDYIINEINIEFEPGIIRASYATRRSISE